VIGPLNPVVVNFFLANHLTTADHYTQPDKDAFVPATFEQQGGDLRTEHAHIDIGI
jgi:hypothetical protein